jgi:hypothetical protein
MNEYRIAGIPLRFVHVFPDYFAGRIERYLLPPGTPTVASMTVEVTTDLPVPDGKPSIVFGTRFLYETPDRTILVVLSDDGTYVKQTVTTDRTTTDVRIRLHPNYGERLPEIEYLATGMAFFDIAAARGLFALHASAIAVDGGAILFSAPSRTGKSTHAALWKKYAEGVAVINDDKPVIGLLDGILTVYGTPWAGKTVENDNVALPLRAIVFLSQAKEPRVVELTAREKILELFRNGYRPREEEASGTLVPIMEAIVAKTDVFRLETDVSERAFRTAYDRIQGGRSQ